MVAEASSLKLDTTRLHDAEVLTNDSIAKKIMKKVMSMSTKTSFIDTECGHSISCPTKPKLHSLPTSLTSYKSNVYLSLVLEHCLESFRKTVIICTSKDQVEIMKMALDRIEPRKQYSVYIPYLLGPLPSKQQKSQIVEASNSTDFILVSDYRSFRGCEAEKCIMLIDLNSEIGPNLYVEILTRSVAYLDIFVAPRTKLISSSTSKIMDKVLKKWQRQKLVTQVSVKIDSTKKHKDCSEINVTIYESGKKKRRMRGELKLEEEESFKKQMYEIKDTKDDHTHALQ